MRYRNLIFGAIVGAIIGSILGGVIFGGAILSFALVVIFAIVGATLGALMGTIKADLIVVVDDRPYLPGDSVDVRVSINPRKGLYIRGGQVELAYQQTSYARGEGWGLEKCTRIPWRSAAPFLQKEQISDGPSGWNVRLSIPDDAPPSVKGAAAEISWQVRVSLDIPGAVDIHREQGLVVSPLVPDPSPPAAAEKLFNQCVASLSFPSPTVRAGETVEGRFTVQVRQDLSVESIRVQLECWERSGEKEANTVKDLVWLKTEKWSATGWLHMETESLTTNQVLEWPVRLHIPKNALPSMAFHDTEVVWRAKGIVAGINRGKEPGGLRLSPELRDLEVQLQIQVYIDHPASALHSSTNDLS